MAKRPMTSAELYLRLLGYVRHHTFTPFGWYRIVVGVAILLLVR